MQPAPFRSAGVMDDNEESVVGGHVELLVSLVLPQFSDFLAVVRSLVVRSGPREVGCFGGGATGRGPALRSSARTLARRGGVSPMVGLAVLGVVRPLSAAMLGSTQGASGALMCCHIRRGYSCHRWRSLGWGSGGQALPWTWPARAARMSVPANRQLAWGRFRLTLSREAQHAPDLASRSWALAAANLTSWLWIPRRAAQLAEWTNLHSPVSNGNTLDLDEGSMEDSAESNYYVNNSEETEEEESEESEEEDSSPSRHEPRTKQRNDPARTPSKPLAPSGRSAKHIRGLSGEPMEQLAKSFYLYHIAAAKGQRSHGAAPAAREVVQLDDNDQRQPAAVVEPVVSEVPVAEMAVVSAPPVSSVVVTTTLTGLQSSAPVVFAAASGLMSPTTVYTTRRVPEDQTSAAKEALIQAELMTQQAKGAYDAIASVYNHSVVLQENVRKACEIGSQYTQVESEKNKLKLECDAMKKLLEDKDQVLVKLKKKSEAHELKLADFNKLMVENEQMKNERDEWAKKLHSISKSESYHFPSTDMQLILRCSSSIELCPDFEKETFEVEPYLDPVKFPVPDDLAVNMYRLNCRLAKVQGYFTRLRAVVGTIDQELWPEDTCLVGLDAVMERLGHVPERVQVCKKSTARCGADVTLSLIRVHRKETREEKLKALQVANTKKLQFEDFRETFFDTATRIADVIDLDTFVEPASLGEP
ncbi:hypothetical protein ZWY2020_033250 [Hordeum vulgare]|nr:hypothetical protein ZWY2020_033250 [Hordeum vulgare]